MIAEEILKEAMSLLQSGTTKIIEAINENEQQMSKDFSDDYVCKLHLATIELLGAIRKLKPQ